MYNLIMEYGLWALAFLIAMLSWLSVKLIALIESKTLRDIASRLFDETMAAVREVGAGYIEHLKLGNADGKLTAEDKRLAKRKAIAIAKANLGKAGIKRLARVFDVEDWIGNKIEAILGEDKLPEAKAVRLGKLQLGE